MSEQNHALNGKLVRQLERELELAIAQVLEQFDHDLPAFEEQHTMHLMSKAAVTVLEAATLAATSRNP